MNRATLKKIWNVASNVLLYLFLAICVFTVVITVLSEKDIDGAAEIFGYQIRIVTSDSMAKCEETDVSEYKIGSIPIRSMIFVQTVPDDTAEANEWYSKLKVGDVLTFRYVYTNQVTITHRIVSITEKDSGGYIIELVGDNKSSESGQLTQVIDTSLPNSTNYVIGKVIGQAYLIGVLISILKTPIGMIFVVILPCFIIILLEVLKIVNLYGTEKRKREQEERQKQDDELRALREKLAELEKASAAENKAETTQEEK